MDDFDFLSLKDNRLNACHPLFLNVYFGFFLLMIINVVFCVQAFCKVNHLTLTLFLEGVMLQH